ncbi:hypothetical protein HYFRA_00006847 [Hymenoscyphus fraxineus]|uniref:Uncharacterized protein n=1 Tax=Hymenoscyphus fraxineus TaxID=746836 RepID=A0A9N9KM99_9HELO|nr:hypothetical protein HYFRA_00006847 [Hymenoscyphus fraxineus]
MIQSLAQKIWHGYGTAKVARKRPWSCLLNAPDFPNPSWGMTIRTQYRLQRGCMAGWKKVVTSPKFKSYVSVRTGSLPIPTWSIEIETRDNDCDFKLEDEIVDASPLSKLMKHSAATIYMEPLF